MSSSTSISEVDVSVDQEVDEKILLLEAEPDNYGGVVVEMSTDHVNLDPAVYVSMLRASLSQWRQQGKKGIWIRLPIALANLVEPTVKEGFYFHHAEPKYLMLVSWLPISTPDTLPANASHRVGIGAFVLNEKNQVLVVQEKNGEFRGSGVWKFPTGVVDEGEDICDAAVREVKEETGIDSKFVEILAFRQSHKSFFEKSDLFFVCMMQPLSQDILHQEAEVEAARWMPLEEYAAQPYNQMHELFWRVADACEARKNGSYSGFSAVRTTSGFSQKPVYLYVNHNGVSRDYAIL
ncbi:hypothetical protein OROHE_010529 [Orobanche hederae]